MKNTTIEMIKIYGIQDVDFLGYAINDCKKLTYHHILERGNGGLLSVDNGAILTRNSHSYLHIVGHYMPIIYQGLNYVLKEINERGYLPTYEDALIIDDLFRHFEDEYFDAKNHKNEPLIRTSYIDDRKQGLRLLKKF